MEKEHKHQSHVEHQANARVWQFHKAQHQGGKNDRQHDRLGPSRVKRQSNRGRCHHNGGQQPEDSHNADAGITGVHPAGQQRGLERQVWR
jgi:hypothetical protein